MDTIKQLGDDISGDNDPTFSPHNLALRYINNLDPARYSTLLVDLKNDVSKGTDSYPTTLVDAFNLAMKWKTAKPKSMGEPNHWPFILFIIKKGEKSVMNHEDS